MKTKLLFRISIVFLILCSSSSLLSAQSKRGRVVRSGEIVPKQGKVEAQLPPPKSLVFKTPPDEQPLKKVKPPVLLNPPVDQSLRNADIRPMNPETVVNVKTKKDLVTQHAPGTFTVFRNTQFAAAPVVNGVTLRGFIPIEPSVANNGRVVFYTTNSYGALSGDGGQTYTYINPFDFFPADGTNDPIDGGFGGDQYVYFEQTRGLMFWLLQYRNNGTTNRQRLCVARTQSQVLNNQCVAFFDFTPASFNIPTPAGAAGTWLDFPDVAVSNNFLYLSSNVFCTSGCGNPGAIGAVMWRIPLNALAQYTAPYNYYYDAGQQNFRFTQGAQATMYWGSHRTNGEIRIYNWADSSGTIGFDDVEHNGYNTGAMMAVSPDGTNFAGNADSRIQAAWVAGGAIGFMWNAAQGGNFPFPHVQVLRFREPDRILLNQGQIWSANHAFLYPSVHPNGRGHLGGTMAWGGGAFFPNVLAWVSDDFNNHTITPLENVSVANGTAGPNEVGFGVYNRWGDYHSTRIHRPYENTWIGTGFVIQAGGPPAGNQREPHYVWFGRERDTPPAANTIYVDYFNASGFENGTLTHPYNTIGEGIFATSPGDTLMIRGGNYLEAARFNRAVTVKSYNGTAIIQAP